MFKKKLLSTFLVLALMFVLAACGGESGSSDNKDETASETGYSKRLKGMWKFR